MREGAGGRGTPEAGEGGEGAGVARGAAAQVSALPSRADALGPARGGNGGTRPGRAAPHRAVEGPGVLAWPPAASEIRCPNAELYQKKVITFGNEKV